MDNKVQAGYAFEFTNDGTAISSGDVVRVGNVIGVASTDIAANATGTVATGYVFSVPCKATDTITQGMQLDWDSSAKHFVAAIGTAASGDVENCAIAWEDDDGATVNALLLRSGGALTA